MYQQITIVGNIGRDAELRYTSNGTAVCDFSVAVNKSRKVNDEWQNDTTWFKVTIWRETAERLAPQLKKGAQVFVVGEVTLETYVNKSGEAAGTLKINADKVRILGSRNGSESPDEPDTREDAGDNIEDIPF